MVNAHITYQSTTPHSPLQANGFEPIWLQRHVYVRGPLLYILSQDGQGNFALLELLAVRITVDVASDVVRGVVVVVDVESEAFGSAIGW
jgi:hypothetical protein